MNLLESRARTAPVPRGAPRRGLLRVAGALSVVLVLVTLSAGEPPHVSFSTAEDAADCAAKGIVLATDARGLGAGFALGGLEGDGDRDFPVGPAGKFPSQGPTRGHPLRMAENRLLAGQFQRGQVPDALGHQRGQPHF